MPIGTTAAVLGGASLIGGVLGSNSASDAAEAQAAAMRKAIAEQRRQYDTTRSDLSPYRQAGLPALSRFSDALGLNGQDAASSAWKSYTESPALGVMLSRVRDNVDASRAARGGLFSGGTAQEIGDRSTEAWMLDSGNWLSRLRDLYGSGQNAAAQTGEFGQRSADNISNLQTGIGNAQAAGAINSGNAWSNSLSNMAGIYGAQQGGAFGAARPPQQPAWGGVPYG